MLLTWILLSRAAATTGFWGFSVPHVAFSTYSTIPPKIAAIIVPMVDFNAYFKPITVAVHLGPTMVEIGLS